MAGVSQNAGHAVHAWRRRRAPPHCGVVCVMTMESVESIPSLRSPRTHVGEIRAARRERARDTNLYKQQLLYDK